MMPLGMEVGLSPGDFLLDGTQPPPQKGDGALQFSAHVYCGQTAAWIKMPLGMEVGLSLGDCVRWGPSLPSPTFGPSIVAKRLDGSRWHLARRWALV